MSKLSHSSYYQEYMDLRAAVASLGKLSFGTHERVIFTINQQDIVCDYVSEEHPADAIVRHYKASHS